MIHLPDNDTLEITTDVMATNGDAIGKVTLTAKRTDQGITLTTSSWNAAALPPHEAAYLAGWLTATLVGDQRVDEKLIEKGF